MNDCSHYWQFENGGGGIGVNPSWRCCRCGRRYGYDADDSMPPPPMPGTVEIDVRVLREHPDDLTMLNRR
jgi:hypothetical protein